MAGRNSSSSEKKSFEMSVPENPDAEKLCSLCNRLKSYISIVGWCTVDQLEKAFPEFSWEELELALSLICDINHEYGGWVGVDTSCEPKVWGPIDWIWKDSDVSK